MGTRGGRPEPRAVAGRPGGGNGSRSSGSRGNGSRNNGAGNAQRPRPAAARTAPPARPGAPAGPPRWFQLTTLVLSLIGLGLSIYLTFTHYTDTAPAACPENATINCAKVTQSPESMVFGIFPVAVLGLAFYLFMTAVNTPWGWRSPLPAIRWARLAAAVTGIAFILYLVYVELFVVNAICLWCTGVHVVTFVLFAFIVASAATWGLSRQAAARDRTPPVPAG